MNTTAHNYLFRVESPWIVIGQAEPEAAKWIPTVFYSRPNVKACVRCLRGRKMRNVQSLMNEIGAALQFFNGFGENWNALAECLQYLDEWLPAEVYVLVIEEAEQVLADASPDQFAALLKTFHEAGEWWSKPIVDNDRFNRESIPFHVLLNISKEDSIFIEKAIEIANQIKVPIG